MTIYSPGNIVLLDYPYTTGGKAKRRPALVVLDSGDADIVVARVTSQIARSSFDVTVVDWAAAGLQLPSIARLDKLLTLEKPLVVRTLGSLSTADRKQIAGVLTTLVIERMQ